MAGLVTADRVLQKGVGQCEHCGTKVIAVLVDMPELTRQWWPVHRAGRDYRVHECKPTRSFREAACTALMKNRCGVGCTGFTQRLSTRPAPRGA